MNDTPTATTKQFRSDWIPFPCTLVDSPNRCAIGLIALATDLSSEPEIAQFLSETGVSMYVSRVPMSPECNVETLRDMEGYLNDATALLLPGDHLDVIAYGCTSGTMAIGADKVAARIRESRPNVAVTDPISSSLKGLRQLGCQRIALLTPYVDEVNTVVEDYVSHHGFDIAVKGSFKQTGDSQICRIPPDAIYDAGVELANADVDALFISCTGLRVSSIIQKLEDQIRKPVVTSNQALTWDALRLAGYKEPVQGFGKLLTV